MNKTRLDSLRVGERFKLVSKGDVLVSDGVDWDAPNYIRYHPEDAALVLALHTLGSRYVIPLDPPPPVPER